MKKLLVLLFLFSGLAIAQTPSNYITDSKGREVLWGEFEMADLHRPAFVDWFQKGYDAYSPDESVLKELKEQLKGHQIKVFMGTWCGDSKREVPKVIKLFAELDFPKQDATLIALRGDGEYYKQGPNGETVGSNIHRVPTIIISKNGQEIGRIVEEPKVSLEADLLAIVKGDYTANYALANSLGGLLDEDPQKNLSNKKIAKLAKKWAGKADNHYELNTLSYVLQTQNRDLQALSVLKLNAILFEQEAQAHYRLGKQLEDLQKYDAAAASYAKATELKPDITDYSIALKRAKAGKSGK